MVILVDHDPEWKHLFQEEASLLEQVFDVDECEAINHIGSTSVSGIKAKPIIDISVGVTILMDENYYVEKLKRIGYGNCQGSKFEQWFLLKKDEKK